MNSFKRCGTAMAMVIASAIPAIAQESTILLGVPGSDTLYRVDTAVAAELCGISEANLARITATAQTVYCTAMEANAAEIDFDNDERFSTFDDDGIEDVAESDDMAGDENMTEEDMTEEDMAEDVAEVDAEAEAEIDAEVDAGTDTDG